MGVEKGRPSELSLAMNLDRLDSAFSREATCVFFASTSWINEIRSCSILSNANMGDRFDESSMFEGVLYREFGVVFDTLKHEMDLVTVL